MSAAANSTIKPDGWLVLDKPRGLGSTQAVGAVKRVLREAGLRDVTAFYAAFTWRGWVAYA